ncbi:DUF4214 domain-containing protein [Marivita sp. S0852]|uniref:DUF4214 domain-containing protein n=1 Tax=Marivita sp. S0852 TaxID=3373893 RepID=UPI0039823BF3
MKKDDGMETVDVQNNTPKGPVTILGEAYVGETLIARPNAIGDADGIDHTTAAFQWLRDGEPIIGETGRTYDVSTVDVGHTLSIQYSYMDLGGTLEVLISDPEPAVPPAGTLKPEDDQPFNPFAVLGEAVVGETLTARPNGVFDDNGINPSTVAFQWLRDGEAIPGATGQSYDVAWADLDAELSVVYFYEDLLGNSKSVTSNTKPSVISTSLNGPNSDQYAPSISDDASNENSLIGTSGSDTLIAAPGVTQIRGDDDLDTAFFAGNQSNYTVIIESDQVLVDNHALGADGMVVLESVELIDFGTEIEAFSGPLDLATIGGAARLDTAELESLVELYIAYFNRAPDAIGLNFWSTARADGMSLDAIALSFADQEESRATYSADMSHSAFATAVYNNVLGRTPDQAGFEFWVDALEKETVSRDQFILKVLEGVTSESDVDDDAAFADQRLADRKYLEDKVDIGAYFAVHRGMSDVDHASLIMSLFDGSDISIDDAVLAIDDHYQDALNPTDGAFLLQVVGVLDTPFGL